MSKFSNLKLRYKIGVGVATTAAIVAGGGIAFAYFTGAGSGTGTGSVGSTNTWLVAQSGSASGQVYPGSGTSIVTFTATNNGNGVQGIDNASQVTPSVNTVGGVGANAGDITTSGNDVPGCLQSWFHVALGTASPGYGTSVAHGSAYTIPVNLTMSDAVNTNQDACKNAAPDVTLTVAHS